MVRAILRTLAGHGQHARRTVFSRGPRRSREDDDHSLWRRTVFCPHHAWQFPALLLGLTRTGGFGRQRPAAGAAPLLVLEADAAHDVPSGYSRRPCLAQQHASSLLHYRRPAPEESARVSGVQAARRGDAPRELLDMHRLHPVELPPIESCGGGAAGIPPAWRAF